MIPCVIGASKPNERLYQNDRLHHLEFFLSDQTRPKSLDFSVHEKFLSMLFFGGEVKEYVSYTSFAACKRT
jgi:hypothetical protein